MSVSANFSNFSNFPSPPREARNDIYREYAAHAFDVPAVQVTQEQRQLFKERLFKTLYGGGGPKLTTQTPHELLTVIADAMRAENRAGRFQRTPLQRLSMWMCDRSDVSLGVPLELVRRCHECRRGATHRCPVPCGRQTCDRHQQACCTRFREQPCTILGAPMPLLEDAQIYVEQRLIWLEERAPSRKKRHTERWLGRWMAIIQREIARRKPTVIRPILDVPRRFT